MSLFNKGSKGFALSQSKGFTLIELLIVIAILGVLAAGILVAIDPIDKINVANDAKVQNDVSGMGRAAEAYAITHDGFYPAEPTELDPTKNDLVTSGELKRVLKAPNGYRDYTHENMQNTPPAVKSSCTAGVDCTGIIIAGQLRAKRYKDTPFWRYESFSGKSCTTTQDLSVVQIVQIGGGAPPPPVVTNACK